MDKAVEAGRGPSKTVEAISWTPSGGVRLLDQTRLPQEEAYVEVRSIDGMVEAIGALRVRGAPLIGIAAAMGLTAAAADAVRRDAFEPQWMQDGVRRLAAARPTAVNLTWALERVARAAKDAFDHGDDPSTVVEALRAEANDIWREEVERCRTIGEAGAPLLPKGARILTHCNTGALAAAGIGTALGIVRVAHERDRSIHVTSCETRPLNQGARLTTWELVRDGIPCRAIVDSAAAWLMARGEIDVVLVGADRVAANGDVANKIGTYALAVAARQHGIPFYVAIPCSTIDMDVAGGAEIPIEVRSGGEILTAPGAEAHNPAFDVTPAELVTAIVTDRGVIEAPYDLSLRRLFD
jgi:methylthioribose-1-phosphate isomerase